MKRFFSLLLASLFFVLTLCACSPNASTPSDDSQGVNPAKVIINEVMSDNENLTMGHALDWIELYYREEGTVDLSAYALTDDLSSPYAFPLTDRSIREGEYLTVVLPQDAPFHLSSEGETVYLTCQGKPISQLTFGASTDGESFSSEGVCEYPTPGYANNREGYLSYLEELQLPPLILSEVLASGDGYDWVEVKK